MFIGFFAQICIFFGTFCPLYRKPFRSHWLKQKHAYEHGPSRCNMGTFAFNLFFPDCNVASCHSSQWAETFRQLLSRTFFNKTIDGVDVIDHKFPRFLPISGEKIGAFIQRPCHEHVFE
jgi:hypothetical protein